MVLWFGSLAMKVENWLRRRPLANFQSGIVYIVELWAAALPNLLRLQEKHNGSGLQAVGVAALECDRSMKTTRTKLNAWLAKTLSSLTVETAGEMNKFWVKPDFSSAIPASFVVDRDGYIAYIGLPMQLEKRFSNSRNGIWRTSDDAKATDTELPRDKPLIVGLDRSLLLTDVLYESFLNVLPRGFHANFAALRALTNGNAAARHHLARVSELDYPTLPYNTCVIDLIHAAKEGGTKVYLATAANEKHAKAIADHLGIFDGWFASDENTVLAGPLKAEILAATFGKAGFDYIGNGPLDLPVWEIANKAYCVGLSNSVKKRLAALNDHYIALNEGSFGRLSWLKALRVHQYVKNILVFVPLATSHQFTIANVVTDVIAFFAFCICASAVYVLNDLLDLKADRAHPSKRTRPFASGLLQLQTGLFMVPALLLLSLTLATTISTDFVGVLAGYFGLTTAYSVYLKRKMIVDVVVLAMLYTTRIVAGGAAIGIQISQWLFIFSMFMFTSLALIKRYVELSTRLERGPLNRSGRDYRIGDVDVVIALAAASGLNAITILALYVASPDVQILYRHPKALWLICPILLYWIGRALMMAHRRLMDDDPIVFALRDRISAIALVSMAVVVIIAL